MLTQFNMSIYDHKMHKCKSAAREQGDEEDEIKNSSVFSRILNLKSSWVIREWKFDCCRAGIMYLFYLTCNNENKRKINRIFAQFSDYFIWPLWSITGKNRD